MFFSHPKHRKKRSGYETIGAPDLLFSKKAASDASLLMSDDDRELFDLKQGYLSVPKISVAGLPNAAGQVIAGLHFLSVAKVLKSVMTRRKIHLKL